MNVSVRLFARARDIAGQDEIELTVPSGATIADLRSALARQYPEMAPLAPNLLFAIGEDYADDTFAFDEQQEIACFPPVSGG